MLDLQKDLFVRLAISAQKDSSLNKQCRTSHTDFHKVFHNNEIEPSDFEKKILDISLPPKDSIDFIPSMNSKHPAEEKIDEKVEGIITNSQLVEISLDLEIAEQVLKKIKEADLSNPKIPLLEQTIYRLKLLLEQKSYV